MNGYGERCGNANLVTIIPNLQLKLGYECVTEEQLASLAQAAHFFDELLNFTPDPDQPYVGRNAFAHKGGMHVAGVNIDPATFEHIDPDVVGNRRELLISELSGKGTVHARARDAGISLGDGEAGRLVERVKELEHRGYHFEAADGSFELLLRKETGDYEPLFRLESWRAIVEKRADGRVETEATIKIWVDGERYVRTAEGNGPVNALDRALRDALVEIHPHLRDIDLVNFKVRILDETKGTGAVTRVLLDASDGDQVWGSIGVSENIIEASWEALVDSLEYGMRVSGRAVARRGRFRPEAVTVRAAREAIPLARPVLGEAEEQRVLEVLRSGRLSLGPLLGEFERAFAERVGAPHASAVSSGTAGLHLALRAVGVSDGDEVITSPFSFVASANVVVYERARPVFADIDPVTFNLDPDAAAAAVTERTTALLPVHVFGYPADIAAFERLGLPIVEDACEALGAVDADGIPVGGRGHPAVFGFYANKQLTTGEGGMVTTVDARGQGADRLRAKPGPRARHGLARPRPPRLQLPAVRYRVRARARPARARWTRCSPAVPGSPTGIAPALGGIEELDLPCQDSTPAHARARRGWFVFVVQLPRRLDRDAVVRALHERGIPSKPYFPAVHLMSYYRERFGHREGEFPVCEDVAARSIALPFFPEMTESQVEQVAESVARSSWTLIRARCPASPSLRTPPSAR